MLTCYSQQRTGENHHVWKPTKCFLLNCFKSGGNHSMQRTRCFAGYQRPKKEPSLTEIPITISESASSPSTIPIQSFSILSDWETTMGKLVSRIKLSSAHVFNNHKNMTEDEWITVTSRASHLFPSISNKISTLLRAKSQPIHLHTINKKQSMCMGVNTTT